MRMAHGVPARGWLANVCFAISWPNSPRGVNKAKHYILYYRKAHKQSTPSIRQMYTETGVMQIDQVCGPEAISCRREVWLLNTHSVKTSRIHRNKSSTVVKTYEAPAKPRRSLRLDANRRIVKRQRCQSTCTNISKNSRLERILRHLLLRRTQTRRQIQRHIERAKMRIQPSDQQIHPTLLTTIRSRIRTHNRYRRTKI